ncbi:MAG: methyltransferase domain-containing protein [Phycisphaerales bacterium]|nr:methyltransferase domain-containing protein [Phycisphaerales bacterium]
MALYDMIGRGYAALRRPDERIAAAIEAALGDAVSVVNIGAGAGSYEPAHRTVLAVEPSAIMLQQRPAGAAPCVRAMAEALPLKSACVDAAMAILTIHHWSDLARGLAEIVRVARKRVVVFTWLPDLAPFWLTDDYFPEIAAYDRTVFPNVAALSEMLGGSGGRVHMTPVPIPHDCTDGLLAAYWRRPERYLRDDVRGAISSFSRIDAGPGLERLRDDLSTGRWAERNRELLRLGALDVGYRLVCCEIGMNAG